MIDYNTEFGHLNLLFRCRGSVFPIALAWAVPSALVSYVIAHYSTTLEEEHFILGEMSNVNSMWSAYTFILGFLVVFRTQQAYGRYWEGATLLRQSRGEWFNAFSSLIAFSTSDVSKQVEVECFHHHVVRLLSILNCVALQTITDMEDDDFVTLDSSGLGVSSMQFLASKTDHNQRMEILIQWIQRLVVENMNSGVLSVPAPIITRFFQELSKGAVCLNQARNMTEIPFPFPYAQMLTLLLVLNCAMTPVVSALVLRNGFWSSTFTFVLVFAFWGANYIAAEIESPFGDDTNDLPLQRLQEDVNASLWTLLEGQAQTPPTFVFNAELHRAYAIRRGTFSAIEPDEVEDVASIPNCRLQSRISEPADSRQTTSGRTAASARTGSIQQQHFNDRGSSISKSMPMGSMGGLGKAKRQKRKSGFATSHPQKPTVRLDARLRLTDFESGSIENMGVGQSSQPISLSSKLLAGQEAECMASESECFALPTGSVAALQEVQRQILEERDKDEPLPLLRHQSVSGQVARPQFQVVFDTEDEVTGLSEKRAGAAEGQSASCQLANLLAAGGYAVMSDQYEAEELPLPPTLAMHSAVHSRAEATGSSAGRAGANGSTAASAQASCRTAGSARGGGGRDSLGGAHHRAVAYGRPYRDGESSSAADLDDDDAAFAFARSC